jgi:hypothetical protein
MVRVCDDSFGAGQSHNIFASSFGMKTLLLLVFALTPSFSAEFAGGIVYHDSNNNQQRDSGERGIYNVGVSNGLEITETDFKGRWRLPASDDAIFLCSNLPVG